MFNSQANKAGKTEDATDKGSGTLPAISLPKGGGAIRGIGEKFGANPVTGSSSMSIPIATSPGRGGFGPQLSISYDSAAGNGSFGLGWNLSLPSITRKTDKGLPRYQDSSESDVFILSGAEDLVPVYKKDQAGIWERDNEGRFIFDEQSRDGYLVRQYRPRVEGLFARIERWTRLSGGDTFWRSISRDNISTFYGKTPKSRIADPADPERIFSWLICQSYDDKGNAIVYEYKEEDSAGPIVSSTHEKNRAEHEQVRTANRYLKRIKYGNRTPNRDAIDWSASDPAQLAAETWMFEVVFDYGEGHYTKISPNAVEPIFVQAESELPTSAKWQVRKDAFSSYRAGFEVRTYRLCQRVLMFHHFPTELGRDSYLVRSTEFEYDENPVATFMTRVVQSGYRRQTDSYVKRSLPPIDFTYSKVTSAVELAQLPIKEIDPVSLENLPEGLDGKRYQWVDLDGEGLSGILTEQGGSWYYKPNLGEGGFGPTQVVAQMPSLAALSGGRQQLLDLAGDGQVDLVGFSGPTPGFFERTQDDNWELFTPFVQLPNIAWGDPNLRFVDLNGDGHADVFITEGDVFTWYPSLAEDGFDEAELVSQSRDEEQGPRLVFADGTQSIYLADMSGDGLTDLVRIRNGEVCYWSNLGYGRFGSKVTMDDSPWFDYLDQFDQRRIRLADIDGSGTTDILYLANDGVCFYYNQSGNGWSEEHLLPQFPSVDNLTSFQVLDLLGSGTACLVWSSPMPHDARQPLKYIDLMGGQKPHLLVRTINNLGAETSVEYVPSTRFYVADKLAGTPWVTRLPFPVHLVNRVETLDRISRNRFTARYAYHHGYFDGAEREFRGFGMVEQWDTEEFAALSNSDRFPNATNIDEASHAPPVHIKTWFHTGAFFEKQRISQQFDKEYYNESGLGDTLLPDGLSSDEAREAHRALKGTVLRQEVYAEDGSAKSGLPYSVSESNYTVEWLQPRGSNKHAVFFTHAREAISYHSERNPADPRISHALTLEVDEFGNVLRSVAIGYPRVNVLGRQPEQNDTHITLTLNRFANRDDQADWRRVGLPVESRSYEVVKPPAAIQPFTWKDLSDLVTALVPLDQDEPPLANTIPYEQWDWRKQWDSQTEPGGLIHGVPVNTRLRLIEHVRTLYRSDDLSTMLPLATVGSLALPYETYKLAFTPGLVDHIYVNEGKLASSDVDSVFAEGGYLHSENDANWWIPSGHVFYHPVPGASSTVELARARAHFFQPRRYHDPFGHDTFVDFDHNDLFAVSTRDELGNVVSAENDHRVLQPRLITDPNGNRTELQFDTLGLVAGTAVMGKVSEPLLGDSFAIFEPDLTQAEIDSFFADPHAQAVARLGTATTRIVYDLNCYLREPDPEKKLPTYAATLARETHVNDTPPTSLKVQVNFSYSDGFGREIQRKVQAEKGPLVEGGSDVSPRWVGSGWTIFNNKGKPVRQYEPFFADTHGFEFDVRIGVSPILFYNPLERVVATLHPNHTWEKVVFDPWRQATWDGNDTVKLDPRTDTDISGYVAKYFKQLAPQPNDWETWLQQRGVDPLAPPPDTPGLAPEKKAAVRTLPHADTPTVAHFDTLGRTFLTIADNGPSGKYETRAELDIENNQRSVTDALGRIVMRYDYDMLGNRIHQASMEAGERWILNDVTGKPIRAWDGRDHTFRTEYDELRRPIRSYVLGADEHDPIREILFERHVHGENHPASQSLNLRGKVFMQFDSAGVVIHTGKNPVSNRDEAYDFKGNLLHAARQLAGDYKQAMDWSAIEPSLNVTSPNVLDLTAIANSLIPLLDTDTFAASTAFDALSRPIELTAPDKSVIRPTYNEANLLNAVEANLRGAAVPTPFVTNINYDAKGQRTRIEYNQASHPILTEYTYDEATFRLTGLVSRRPLHPEPDKRKLQDLSYTYDPVGNITHILDQAQPRVFFDNDCIDASNDYGYDALYRLLAATGREHKGQNLQPGWDDSPRMGNPIPYNCTENRKYTETYRYDAVGNILQMIHHLGNNLESPGTIVWNRRYQYRPDNNQLRCTSIPGEPPLPEYSDTLAQYAQRYAYDAHGNMKTMPHLTLMQWDYKDQLSATSRQVVNQTPPPDKVPETTYYVYDAAGQRVRKVTERQNGTRKEERIYLGGFELYREYNGASGAVDLERETLHVMDDKQRIALVETRTDTAVPQQLTRYQFGNHLGSASLELDDQAQIISYEEYTPYGSSSYQAVRSQTETAKRYRYTGKERDEDSGLYYHGARYYAPWLGRWVTCDPAGMVDGLHAYLFTRCNPIVFSDSSGLAIDNFEELRQVAQEVHKAGLAVNETKPSGARVSELPPAVPRMQTTPVDARVEGNKGAARARTFANSAKQNPSGLGKPQPGDEMAHMSAARANAQSAIPNDIANAKANIKAMPAQGAGATVIRQDGTAYKTDVHAAHEPKLDEIQARAQQGKTPGTLDSSMAAQDALQEAKIVTEVMTREYMDTVKAGGPAAPEPGPSVNPATGVVESSGGAATQSPAPVSTLDTYMEPQPRMSLAGAARAGASDLAGAGRWALGWPAFYFGVIHENVQGQADAIPISPHFGGTAYHDQAAESDKELMYAAASIGHWLFGAPDPGPYSDFHIR